MTYELTRRDVNRLRKVLIELLDQSEADSCLICDGAGHVLAHENVNRQDPLLVSALGAGVFAATRELARILGEDEFSTVLHQGVKRSILIAAATEEILLVVMFSGEHRVGLVKLYAPTAAAAVRGVFESIRDRGPTAEESADRSYVLKDTTDIFAGTPG